MNVISAFRRPGAFHYSFFKIHQRFIIEHFNFVYFLLYKSIMININNAGTNNMAKLMIERM